MNRRAFVSTVALGLLAAPLVAEPQKSARIPKVCFLSAAPQSRHEGFVRGLRDLGYVDGSTIAINYSYGSPERFPDLVAECLRLKTDIILTTTTPAALAAKKATSTLPILVVAIGDPVGSGLVASLARPGGNVTGLTQMSYGLSSKRLELLKEAMPRLSRVTVISHLTDPIGAMQVKEIEQAARALSVQLQHRGIRTAGDLAAAFEAAAKDGAQALLLTIESIFVTHRAEVVELAAKHRLPAMYPTPYFPEVGGLMSYGVNFTTLFERAAVYSDKILKGAKPGDLPVEQPTAFELVINLKTAKALGLTIPQSLLVRADQVIQ